MALEIPEPGTDAFVDLICLLDRARYENAKRWIVVVVDDASGEIIHGCGPFAEAEQALVEAGQQEAALTEEESSCSFKIVPLWEAGE